MNDSPRKIFLIEDNPSLVKVYKQRLEKEGFEVIVSASGGEAVQRVNEERPDLIILDLILPEKSGFEILRELKESASTKDIPVLVLSVLEQQRDIDEAKRLGATEYLMKPETALDDLVEHVKKTMKG